MRFSITLAITAIAAATLTLAAPLPSPRGKCIELPDGSFLCKKDADAMPKDLRGPCVESADGLSALCKKDADADAAPVPQFGKCVPFEGGYLCKKDADAVSSPFSPGKCVETADGTFLCKKDDTASPAFSPGKCIPLPDGSWLCKKSADADADAEPAAFQPGKCIETEDGTWLCKKSADAEAEPAAFSPGKCIETEDGTFLCKKDNLPNINWGKCVPHISGAHNCPEDAVVGGPAEPPSFQPSECHKRPNGSWVCKKDAAAEAEFIPTTVTKGGSRWCTEVDGMRYCQNPPHEAEAED